jgi:ABC-type lipoprotein export system ATPase subunit
MILCEQLTKAYRTKQGEVRSLDGVNLEVRPGEFVTVRGPSGCGKTTLLLVLGGMLRPTGGTVAVCGLRPYALDPPQRARFRAQNIGFVFQMFHLVPYLTVLENVLLAKGSLPSARHSSPSSADAPQSARARAEDLLAQLGLRPRLHHKPAALSAGERQRTAIARALLNQPKLILADEPTGNLDPDNANEVFAHLRTFHRGGGTVVVVTHGSTAEDYAERVVRMEQGRIL